MASATKPIVYPIPARGYATAFSELETPPDYALEFKNRFVNGTGNAEKRQGEIIMGDSVLGAPAITGIHELVIKDGSSILFKSGGGIIYTYDENTLDWTVVKTGLANRRLTTVQMNDRLIFVNGEDRNFFTEDGVTFNLLEALLEVGKAGTGTAQGQLKDVEISAWATNTLVAPFDIIQYPNIVPARPDLVDVVETMVTKLSAATLEHCNVNITTTIPILSRTNTIQTAPSIGSSPSASIDYRIIDTIELNVIPTNDFVKTDNTFVAAAGTSDVTIKATQVPDWTKTEIRKGDYVYNTVRNGVTKVTEITSSALTVLSIPNQVAGDTLTLHKSAMPISTDATVRFGRLYLVDARDRRKIRISGSNNPFDFSRDAANLDVSRVAGTFNSNTFDAGVIQPEGDIIQSIGTFQNFFIIAGKQNIYVYSGIQAVGDDADFKPQAVFPQGCVSRFATVNLGNDFTWISPDGVQSFAISTESSSLKSDGMSIQLNNEFRKLISNLPENEVQLFQYPRRSWLMAKLGDALYVLNYAPLILSRNPNAREVRIPSWYKFDGAFATRKVFFIDSKGRLLTGGGNASVYLADADGQYTDNGLLYKTDITTAWLTLDEPTNRPYVHTIKAIAPTFQTGPKIGYNLQIQGDWDGSAEDEIIVSAIGTGTAIQDFDISVSPIGGNAIYSEKYPFRCRGRAFKIKITTNDDKGPDILGRFTLFANRQSTK